MSVMALIEALLKFGAALLGAMAEGKLTRDKALAAADAAAAMLRDPGPPC